MEVGRKIYYELATGNIIQDTGERSGSVVETTQEQDFIAYAALAERIPSTVGCLQLEYGEFAQDFAACNGYLVDVSGDTPSLLFSYPDPADPEAPPVFQEPLSVKVNNLESELSAAQTELSQQKATSADQTLLILDLYEMINPPA